MQRKAIAHLRNILDLLVDGKTPYERSFGERFAGPIVPCGAKVEHHPITAKDKARLHQFGKMVLPGILRRGAFFLREKLEKTRGILR